MLNSVLFSMFSELGIYCHNQCLNISFTRQRNPFLLAHIPLPLSHWETPSFLSVPMDLPLLAIYYEWNHRTDTWSFVIGLFRLACFQDSSML